MKKKRIPLLIIETVALYAVYFILLFLIHKYSRELSRISSGTDGWFWAIYQVPILEKILMASVSVMFSSIFSKIIKSLSLSNPALIHILSGTFIILIIVIYTLCFVVLELPIFSIHALTAIQSMAIGGVLQIAEGIRIQKD